VAGLRRAWPDDARILVIYGQGHKGILEHLFEDHSGFVLTSANDVLGGD
jgi:hypothetical protein